jgi:phosphohistidine phosphatase
MQREILLMRHAKSRHDEAAITDFGRDLAPRAEKDVAKICRMLRDYGLIPGHIYSSPAIRARHTALLVCRHLPLAEDYLSYSPDLYAAETDELLSIINGLPSSGDRPMIIGHNPALDSVLEYLCGTALPLTSKGKLMTTASVAHVLLPGGKQSLTQLGATLLHLFRPGG